jgi:hypothetical protein
LVVFHDALWTGLTIPDKVKATFSLCLWWNHPTSISKFYPSLLARDKILISANPCKSSQHILASMIYFLIKPYRLNIVLKNSLMSSSLTTCNIIMIYFVPFSEMSIQSMGYFLFLLSNMFTKFSMNIAKIDRAIGI